jgi:hypothetical protein
MKLPVAQWAHPRAARAAVAIMVFGNGVTLSFAIQKFREQRYADDGTTKTSFTYDVTTGVLS